MTRNVKQLYSISFENNIWWLFLILREFYRNHQRIYLRNTFCANLMININKFNLDLQMFFSVKLISAVIYNQREGLVIGARVFCSNTFLVTDCITRCRKYQLQPQYFQGNLKCCCCSKEPISICKGLWDGKYVFSWTFYVNSDSLTYKTEISSKPKVIQISESP